VTTKKQLAEKLGVHERTIRNHERHGYSVVLNPANKIDLEKSIQAFVKYQSEVIRMIKAEKGRRSIELTGNTKQPETAEEWKTEKEKQAAIKIKLQNEKDIGEMIPSDAMFELYNAPLGITKSKLIDISNQIQKRIPLLPDQVKLIDDVVSDALAGLNEKGEDELQPLIKEIIERYSKYHRAAAEDADYSMDNG